MLVLSPLLVEADFSANAHIDFFESTLELYRIPIQQIQFIVGDNCSTNKAMARKMDIPMIGCASHRFNLAMKLIFNRNELILDKVNNLMVKLKTLKNLGVLREHAPECNKPKSIN